MAFVGRSSVVSPRGEVLAGAGRGHELLIAEVDTSVVDGARDEVRYFTDRRPDLYGSLTSPSTGAVNGTRP